MLSLLYTHIYNYKNDNYNINFINIYDMLTYIEWINFLLLEYINETVSLYHDNRIKIKSSNNYLYFLYFTWFNSLNSSRFKKINDDERWKRMNQT